MYEKSVFDAAVMWSVIQKKKDLQQAGIGKDDEEIYILNRIFAPVFNISARTRGGKNLELDAEKFKRFIAKEEELDNITVEDCDVDEEVEEAYSQVNIFDIIVPTENDGEYRIDLSGYLSFNVIDAEDLTEKLGEVMIEYGSEVAIEYGNDD